MEKRLGATTTIATMMQASQSPVTDGWPIRAGFAGVGHFVLSVSSPSAPQPIQSTVFNFSLDK
jgi:hypothetical protein